MTLSAHPSTGVLSDYASGALHAAPGVVVLAHLQFCPHCRAIVRTFEEVGGALLRAAPPERMGLAALGQVLQGIEESAPPFVPGPRRRARDLPSSMAGIKLGARRRLEPGGWLVPIRASRRRDWRVFVYRTPAGLRRLGWRDVSLVCVLGGGFRRGGRTYRAGDFSELLAGEFRPLNVLPGGPLVALIAVRRPRVRVWPRDSRTLQDVEAV